jgi:hypothetical protein
MNHALGGDVVIVANKAINEDRIPRIGRPSGAKLRHKDRDARWTVKFTKTKPREDRSKPRQVTDSDVCSRGSILPG